jgi:hypothetical protein
MVAFPVSLGAHILPQPDLSGTKEEFTPPQMIAETGVEGSVPIERLVKETLRKENIGTILGLFKTKPEILNADIGSGYRVYMTLDARNDKTENKYINILTPGITTKNLNARTYSIYEIDRKKHILVISVYSELGKSREYHVKLEKKSNLGGDRFDYAPSKYYYPDRIRQHIPASVGRQLNTG